MVTLKHALVILVALTVLVKAHDSFDQEQQIIQYY